nr:ATR-interacting protein [Misgurnus anguillicaudatus]
MEFPPSKRLKGHQMSAGADPFDDDIDFTQDDLAQIDIIASQAVTGEGQNSGSKRTYGSVFPCPDDQSKAPSRSGRKTFALGDACSSSAFDRRTEPQRNDAIGDGHTSKGGEDLHLKQLEDQQAELKRKLKEVEEEILMKNGEIRVLRDSLRLANQEKEQQRQAQVAVEKERAQAQSERERELNRKVQSLQSELHFKEAEMNEMRGKLQSGERGVKLPGTPARNTVQSPAGRAFMTKETFSAGLAKKTSPIKGHLSEGAKLAQSKTSFAEEPHSDQTIISDVHQEGCVLLKLLLQQQLDPSTLSLCHLLSVSPDALPNVLSQHGYVSPGSLATSSSSSADLHRPQSRFHQLQSLAMSGLTALATHRPMNTQRNGCSDGALHLALRTCPPAVHFLPLLTFHISTYCQTLESVESSGKASLHGSSLSGSSDSSLTSSLEESLSGQEDLALAAMKALYHVVSYSCEALETVLCHQDAETPERIDVDRPQCSKSLLSTSEHLNGEVQTQIPLLKRLLQLADPAFITAAGQREAVMSSSLKTLCVLAERAQENQVQRLKVVLSSQVLLKCLTPEMSHKTVHLSVRILSLIICNNEMAVQLCAHEYPCPLIRLFQYVTSRPDKSTSEDVRSHLELEVIRLVTKLFTQNTGTWAAFCQTSCQCIHELVRTVVMLLHRQWLRTKRREGEASRNRIWAGSGVQVLREALVFLHWLLLKDSSFSEHCLDVLHMYDQVIPAIRDTFRLIPDLSESEELALEEICRSETEYVEDMDTETGP